MDNESTIFINAFTHYIIKLYITFFFSFSSSCSSNSSRSSSGSSSSSSQGLTLRFQARCPKRSFDEFSGQKQDFCIIIYTISGPSSEKLRRPQQNLGAYAPGPVGMSNHGSISSSI